MARFSFCAFAETIFHIFSLNTFYRWQRRQLVLSEVFFQVCAYLSPSGQWCLGQCPIGGPNLSAEAPWIVCMHESSGPDFRIPYRRERIRETELSLEYTHHELTLAKQVHNVVLDFFCVDSIWRSMVIVSQISDCPEICSLCARWKIPRLHISDHPFS